MTSELRPFVLLLAIASSHCGTSATPGDAGGPGERPCTSMACASAATLRAAVAPSDAAPGEHAFAVEADGHTLQCTVTVTDTTSLAHGTCDGRANVRIGPVMRGKEMRLGDVVGYTEEPVPGRFEWVVTVYGTPKVVRVVHTSAGRAVLDRRAELAYAEDRPNGPGCEPLCHAATADLTAR